MSDFYGSEAAPERRLVLAYTLKRPASAEEIAEVSLFLMSDEASFVTGAKLPIDDGLNAR